MGALAGAQLRPLRVRGPFKGPSGYDHHVREFVREFVRQGIAIELVDIPTWGPVRLPNHLLDPWYERLNTPVQADITLHFATPHEVRPDGRSLDVNYTMFEATRAPDFWIEHNQRHTLVIVPTESSRVAWVNSGLPEEKVRVSPLGINATQYGGLVEPLPLRTEDGDRVSDVRTRFLNVSEVGPRKNLIGLLKAWLLATSPDDDAMLVVKLGSYAAGWLEMMKTQLARVTRQSAHSFHDAAPVHVLFDLLSDEEMPRLYAAATHYISLSHGEGWDLPMVEAAASGLRLIAPDHSAYRAYLTPESATMLPSREVPARFAGDPGLQRMFTGANWWEPDIDAAAEAIRAAIDGRDLDKHGAREHVLSTLSWEQSTRRLIDILGDVGATQRVAQGEATPRPYDDCQTSI